MAEKSCEIDDVAATLISVRVFFGVVVVLAGGTVLWGAGQWEGAHVEAGSKTAISRERLGAGRRPTAGWRAAGQGYATAAPRRPRGAYLRRYAGNAEGRPHGHFGRRAVTGRWWWGVRTRQARVWNEMGG